MCLCVYTWRGGGLKINAARAHEHIHVDLCVPAPETLHFRPCAFSIVKLREAGRGQRGEPQPDEKGCERENVLHPPQEGEYVMWEGSGWGRTDRQSRRTARAILQKKFINCDWTLSVVRLWWVWNAPFLCIADEDFHIFVWERSLSACPVQLPLKKFLSATDTKALE